MSTVGCPSFVDGTATMRRANAPVEPPRCQDLAAPAAVPGHVRNIASLRIDLGSTGTAAAPDESSDLVRLARIGTDQGPPSRRGRRAQSSPPSGHVDHRNTQNIAMAPPGLPDSSLLAIIG